MADRSRVLSTRVNTLAQSPSRSSVTTTTNFDIRCRTLHPHQERFVTSKAPRKIVRAGRRGGKTTGAAELSVQAFLDRRRVLYATPTAEQIETFWREVKRALAEPLEAGLLGKNETLHTIEVPGTQVRIRAKTAWNADTLRGDYADLLILDEWQLMDEDTWSIVGAPMLLDNDGDAVFVYTPPSLHSRSVSKARDPRHAARLFTAAQKDESGRWETFHFTSHDNPHIDKGALEDIARDMTQLSYRQEILAEDIDEAPGALWKREMIDRLRVASEPQLDRIVVGVDPAATSHASSSETGIIVAGIARENGHVHGYVLEDISLRASPAGWAAAAIRGYHDHRADRIIGEVNNGGEMVEHTLRTVDATVPFKAVHASRGKAVRAEPIAALYEQGRMHHVGEFGELEDQLCQWQPGDRSPDRLDALVWAFTELTQGEPEPADVLVTYDSMAKIERMIDL